MPKLLLRCLPFLFAWPLAAQTDADTSLVWYGHDKIWLNLSYLHTQPKTQYQPDLHFKNNSPQYNYYFAALTIDKLAYKGRYFEILPNNGLKITNIRTDEVAHPENPDAEAERYGQHFLFAAADGVCYIKHLSGEHGYKIYKYNLLGEVLFSTQVAHTDKVKTDKLEYFRPYLQYLAHTPYQLVFASYIPQQNITVAIDLRDGSQQSYPFSAQGCITDSRDAGAARTHKGFIYLDQQKNLQIQLLQPQQNIQLQIPELQSYNSFEGIIKGNILALLAYDRTQGGARLLGIDLQTQKVLWQNQIPAPSAHKQPYYNKIWLSNADNKIIVEGMESQQRYLRLYDFQGGQLLFPK